VTRHLDGRPGAAPFRLGALGWAPEQGANVAEMPTAGSRTAPQNRRARRRCISSGGRSPAPTEREGWNGEQRGRGGWGGGADGEKKGGEDDVWVPHFGSWDSVKIWRMMDAGEENIKERISLSWQEYSVLEENMEYNECGWSKGALWVRAEHYLRCVCFKRMNEQYSLPWVLK
jgi:hypothetical protein